ncbi:hypothetical protein [Vibrio europaeus]|uniref:hypothetical protein n=1 Tax=Vibrio europaeus TaxID=300876 RepID=UPI00233E8B4E|nr:hypothetical protein [Vibrio europaeus]MDC5822042.1 hypothetical protein [Vibrio europaeus]MDC5855127.1 hypothetical protein [Vibrio europaeus]MDC5870111.1 hypothetical protein [Vibrio europaeus]
MSIFCLVLTFLVCMYFLFFRRKIDILILGLFSFVLYNFPILIGSVPDYPGNERVNIESFLYVYYSFFLVSYFFVVYAFDSYKLDESSTVVLHVSERMVWTLVIFASLAMFYFSSELVFSGLYIKHGLEKSQLLEMLPPIYNWLIYYVVSLSIFLSCAGYYRLSFLIVALLVFDIVLVGMRVHFILAVIGSLLACFYNARLSVRQVSISIFSGVAFVFLVVFIKPVLRIVSSSDYPAIALKDYFSGSQLLSGYLGRMEPFPQVSIFNTVVKNSVNSNTSEWWDGVITLLGFGDSQSVIKFTSIIAEFYPGVREGALGSSSIGEIYALFGVAGILLFCLLYPVFLAILSHLCNKFGDLAKFIIIPLVPIVGFYFYRSDLFFSLLQIRRLLFYSLIFFGIVLIVRFKRNRFF